MSLLSLTKKILSRQAAPQAAEKKTKKAAAKGAKKAKETVATGNALLAAQIGLQLMLTEKSIGQQEGNVAVFKTLPQTTKGQIAQAVAAKYGVAVQSVRTSQFPGKRRSRGQTIGRTNYWKKAYVTVDDISKLSVSA
jgi:large subunit ribosomal protein L23